MSNNLLQQMVLKYNIMSKYLINIVLIPYRKIKGKAVNADIHTLLKLMEEKFVKDATIRVVFVINAIAVIKLMMVQKYVRNAHHVNAVTVNNAKIRMDVLVLSKNKDLRTLVNKVVT